MATEVNGCGAIYRAMGAIIRDTTAIAKDQRNAQQGFNFRGIDQVYDALHSVFAKHGVFLLTEVLSHEKIEKPTRSGSVALHHFLKVGFRFVSAEDGSSVESIMIGEAADSGDKGINKCYSAALKYCLFQALLIPLNDGCDPDSNTIEFAVPTRYSGEPQQKVILAKIFLDIGIPKDTQPAIAQQLIGVPMADLAYRAVEVAKSLATR